MASTGRCRWPALLEVIALAVFTPRRLVVIGPYGQVLPLLGPEHFHAVAPDLAARLAGIIEESIAGRLRTGVHLDPATAARERRAFRFPVEREVDGIERFWRRLAETWRGLGLERAAEFLTFYLDGRGRNDPDNPDKTLTREEALREDPIRRAYEENIYRFNRRTMISPGPENEEALKEITRISTDSTVRSVTFRAAWDYLIALHDQNKRLQYEIALGNIDFFLSAGQTNLHSEGVFEVNRDGRKLFVTANLTHLWRDSFDFGNQYWFDRQAHLLESVKGAKPFSWEAMWEEEHKAEMELVPNKDVPAGIERNLLMKFVPVF